MTLKFILLVLPVSILAKIEVNLSGKVEGDTANVTLYIEGDDIGIITDIDMNTFNLSDNDLKNAVNSYFGKRPHDAYLRGPTVLGDLYEVFQWKKVKKTLKPAGGKILSVSFKPVVIYQQFIENSSSKPINLTATISHQIQNTASSTWSREGELSTNENISYNIKFEIDEVGGDTFFYYNSSWGENMLQINKLTVGDISPMNVVLDPKDSVVAEIHAARVSVQIEIFYEAFLQGTTVVYYADTYKEQNYWPLDIVDCMNSAGLSNQKVSREVVDIEFYTDSKVIYRDISQYVYGSRLLDY